VFFVGWGVQVSEGAMALAEAHQQQDADKAMHFEEVTALQRQLRDAAAALKEAQCAAGEEADAQRQVIAEAQAARTELTRKVPPSPSTPHTRFLVPSTQSPLSRRRRCWSWSRR
jgi:hypothetical protein